MKRYNINFSDYNRNREVRKKSLLSASIVFGILFFILFITGAKKISDISFEREKVKKSAEDISGKIQAIKAEREKSFSNEELSLIEAKLSFYGKISGGRLYMTSILNAIEEKTPSSVVLKSLDIDTSRQNFMVNGESLNPEAVAYFIPKLQSLSFVKKVEISKQTFSRQGDKKILVSEFEIKGETY